MTGYERIIGGDRGVARGFLLCALLLGLWLLWALVKVDVELDDGYTTIINSQYFLGISPDYFWNRGPLMAWVLMPAEWLANLLGLHPLSIRPHHVITAALHLGYFVGCWMLIRQRLGARWPVLVALIAALANVVFFSYAPFISHDILPGLIALAMLALAHDYARQPAWRLWLALATLGLVGPLFKQTYGAIWVAVLIAHLAVAAAEWRGWRVEAKVIAGLGAGALVSGMLTWLVYAAVLSGSFPDTPWLLKPLRQMETTVLLFQQEGPIGEIIYQQVYLRNLSAYGLLAISLALPGLYLSWRHGNRFQRTVAIAWLFLFTLMQLLKFKELRYLEYLAPLTAVLLVPVIERLWNWRRAYRYGLLALLAVDLGFAAREALRLEAPFYRQAVKEFLRVLPPPAELPSPLVMMRYLSFLSPESYAFFGDRYHRIVNLNWEQIRALYGYRRDQVIQLPSPEDLHSGYFKPGGILIFVNDVAARVPPIRPDNRTTLQDHFLQFIAVAEEIELDLVGESYRLTYPSPQPILILRAPQVASSEGRTPVMSKESFGKHATLGLLGLSTAPERLRTIGFRVHALCTIRGCQADFR